MIWLFLVLGVSTLVVVFVAIALYMRIRRHMQRSGTPHEEHEIENSGKSADRP
jgi:hypothetical protein